jgi:transglutaminase-like putative cysteine protease
MTPALAPALNWEARLTGDDPDQQVADTINLMAKYVREDARAPVVVEAAQEAAPSDDPDDVVEGIFYYVRDLIRFQHDELTAAPLSSQLAKVGLADIPVVEVLIRPRDLLTWRRDTGKGPVGDCDDYAMLTAALLRARGVEASFVTVAADPSHPQQFSHVYVAAYPPSGRIALDTSHGKHPGWEAERVGRREEWPVGAGLVGLVLTGLVIWALVGMFWKRRTA